MPTIVAVTPASASATACQPPASPPPAFSPTFQPMSATNNTFGPGAACASATLEVNCMSLSQRCSFTR